MSANGRSAAHLRAATMRRGLVGVLLLGALVPASAGVRADPLSDPRDGRTPGLRDAVIDGWQRVPAARLDEMRGGFSMPDLKLQIKFGFDQIVIVNDELVATTRLNLEQMRSQIVASTQAAVDPQALRAQIEANLRQAGLRVGSTAAQTAPANTTSSTPAAAQAQTATTLGDAANAAGVAAEVVTPAGAAATPTPATVGDSSVAQPVSTPSPAAGGGNGASGAAGGSGSAPVVSSNSLANAAAVMPVTLVQSGGGNFASVNAVSGNATTTIVQNSLDGQKIQVFSQIEASVNSGRLMSAIERSEALRDATIRSLAR